jgi:hypothetical protein
LSHFTQYRSAFFRAEIARLPLAADVLAGFTSQMRDKDEAAVLQAISLLSFICEVPEHMRAVASMQGAGGVPSPEQRLKLVLTSIKRKPKKTAESARCEEKLSALLAKLESANK